MGFSYGACAMTFARLSFWCVALLFAGAQIGVALVNVAIVGMAVLCVWHWRQLRVPRDLLVPVVVLIVLSVLHSLIGLGTPWNLGYLAQLRVILCLLMVGALSASWSSNDRKLILRIALSVAVISMAYSLFQVLSQTPGPLKALHPDALRWSSQNYRSSSEWLTFSINGLRGTGLVHHVLSFAHVSCVLALAGFAHVLFGKKNKLLWVCLACAAVLGILLSGARAGLVGFLFGALVLAALKSTRTTRVRAIVVVVLLAAVGVGFVHVVTDADRRSRIGSFSGRLAIWNHARTAAYNAFPRGMGYGTYPAYAKETYRNHPELKTKVTGWAHNVWLSLAVETPIAIIAWIWLLVAITRRSLRQAQGDADEGYGAAVVATLGAWLIIGLFHDSHFQREYFPLILSLWGLCLSPSWLDTMKSDH